MSANPKGVYGWQIAGHLDVADDSAHKSLLRLQSRGKVVLASSGKTNADYLWALSMSGARATPPIFRAMETLASMQTAAREKLIKATELEAA
jgi:hypothetical protein